MNRFYVSKPYIVGLDKLGLKYYDLLTYVSVKSFMNHKDNKCFPAYETIAKAMGASRSFVINSVTRLVKCGLVRRDRRFHTSNKFYFIGKELPTKIPPEVLSLDLTIYEKAMLIIMRQFATGLPIIIRRNINWIADELGVTYKTVYTQVQALISKGYLQEVKLGRQTYYNLTDLIDWFYQWDRPANYNELEDEKPKSQLLIC